MQSHWYRPEPYSATMVRLVSSILTLHSTLICSRVPPNVHFEVDDAEDDWVFSDRFDLIHTRTLCGGIKDWPRFHRQAYDFLVPGGWFEMQENEAWFQREDGTLPPWSKLFLEKLDEASIRSGRRLNVAHEQKQHMINAGFINVQDVVFKVSSGVEP